MHFADEVKPQAETSLSGTRSRPNNESVRCHARGPRLHLLAAPAAQPLGRARVGRVCQHVTTADIGGMCCRLSLVRRIPRQWSVGGPSR